MSENQDIEYKESWNDKYLETICAFANADGGIIFIGIDDNGKPIGLQEKQYKKLLDDIPSKLKSSLRISASVIGQKQENKNIIEVRINKYEEAISYRGRYFIRTGSSTRILEGNELINFLMKKQNKTWDRYIEQEAVIEEDIDENSINKFKKLSNKTKIDKESITDILKKLHLIDKNNRLTRASILLFGNDTQRYYPSAYIKIGYFKTETDVVTTDIIKGNLFEQIESAETILETKYLSKFVSFNENSYQRTDTLEFPKLALREAIINALIHRDYMETSNIDIKIYNDKLIISNACRLDFSISRLKETHESRPKNLLLADAFNHAGYIEKWGRGTLKIIEECINNDLPEPDFIEHDNIINVILYKDKLTTEYLSSLGLTDNHIKAVLYVKQYGEITNEIYQKLTDVSKPTATRHLKMIEEKGIFIKKGDVGKGTKYILYNGSNGS